MLIGAKNRVRGPGFDRSLAARASQERERTRQAELMGSIRQARANKMDSAQKNKELVKIKDDYGTKTLGSNTKNMKLPQIAKRGGKYMELSLEKDIARSV